MGEENKNKEQTFSPSGLTMLTLIQGRLRQTADFDWNERSKKDVVTNTLIIWLRSVLWLKCEK